MNHFTDGQAARIREMMTLYKPSSVRNWAAKNTGGSSTSTDTGTSTGTGDSPSPPTPDSNGPSPPAPTSPVPRCPTGSGTGITGTCFDKETHTCGGEVAASTNWCREGASYFCCRHPSEVTAIVDRYDPPADTSQGETTFSSRSSSSPFITVYGDYESKLGPGAKVCIGFAQFEVADASVSSKFDSGPVTNFLFLFSSFLFFFLGGSGTL
jgi:hypothetical protein